MTGEGAQQGMGHPQYGSVRGDGRQHGPRHRPDVAEFERQGTLDNTLIMYLQDNGACAEGFGRYKPNKPYRTDYKPLARTVSKPRFGRRCRRVMVVP